MADFDSMFRKFGCGPRLRGFDASPSSAWLALLLLPLLAGVAEAQSLYVTDEVVITLRTGPSTQNTIIQNLSTGDTVTVLEDDREDGYARVRTSSGTDGWVLRRYLQEMPAASTRLSAAQQSLAEARARVAELEAMVDSLSEQLGTVTQRMQEAESATTSLNAELVDVRTTSANALTLRDQYESQRRRALEFEQRAEQLAIENGALASRANREWFLLGAGVLVAGIVLGLIIPSLRRKRRLNW